MFAFGRCTRTVNPAKRVPRFKVVYSLYELGGYENQPHWLLFITQDGNGAQPRINLEHTVDE